MGNRGQGEIRNTGHRAGDGLQEAGSTVAAFPAIDSILIHIPERMPVSGGAVHDARRQQVLRRRAIKEPFLRIGEIGESRALAHIKAMPGFFTLM